MEKKFLQGVSGEQDKRRSLIFGVLNPHHPSQRNCQKYEFSSNKEITKEPELLCSKVNTFTKLVTTLNNFISLGQLRNTLVSVIKQQQKKIP
jgi:hypothetical protein